MTLRLPLPAGLRHRPLAHRGLHDAAAGRPENSRAAIIAAIAAGYGIEIDLQLSADGQAMVFHDATLDRMTRARGPVTTRSAATLATTRLRDSDEGIPTLPEILTLVAGRAPLLIEIKDTGIHLGPVSGRLEAATAQALAGYDGEVAVMSFNPHSVAIMAQLAPHLPRGLITAAFDPAEWTPLPPATGKRLHGIPDYDRVGASFISHDWRDLTRPRVAELAAAGAAVLCWTVCSAQEEAIARRIADNITFENYRPALHG